MEIAGLILNNEGAAVVTAVANKQGDVAHVGNIDEFEGGELRTCGRD